MNSIIAREGILRCRGYRNLESEGWSYEYLVENEELCSILELQLMGLDETFVRIRGFDLMLGSSFSLNSTLGPDMARIAMHSDGSREAFRIQLLSIHPTRFLLLWNGNAFDILPSPDGWAFFKDAQEIARLKKPSRQGPLEKLKSIFASNQAYENGEPYIDAELRCPLEPELVLAILSYPILKFA